MGSVITETECPFCGYEFGTLDTYYRSGEVYFWCGRCGSSSAHTITNKDSWEADTDNWTPVWKEEEVVGECSYRYGGMKDDGTPQGVISCGGFKKEEVRDFRDWVNKEKNNLGTATLTYKNDNDVWVTENLLTGVITPFINTNYEED